MTASCLVPLRRRTVSGAVSAAFSVCSSGSSAIRRVLGERGGAQGDGRAFPVVPPDSVEVGGGNFLDQPCLRRPLQTLPTAPPLRLAVTGNTIPSARAQASERMTAYASDSWIRIMETAPVLARPRPGARKEVLPMLREFNSVG